ncbi:MFS transporter [Sphaerimonospora mesophila]|uniref:MFS transporter n=1 Tax=Sphaerimonospora mesophila TaxID=37483 RepID=UPI000A7517CB
MHRAWIVAAVAFVAIIGAAGFRATPGVLINPLQDEFGWTKGTISLAVSVNLMLYGLCAPFAAALMDRFGMRRVVSAALLLVSTGSGLTVPMTASRQLIALCACSRRSCRPGSSRTYGRAVRPPSRSREAVR